MLKERKLTPSELAKREDILKDLRGNKREFVKRYGKDAEQVMYGISTKRSKMKKENIPNLKEMVKKALSKPLNEAPNINPEIPKAVSKLILSFMDKYGIDKKSAVYNIIDGLKILGYEVSIKNIEELNDLSEDSKGATYLIVDKEDPYGEESIQYEGKLPEIKNYLLTLLMRKELEGLDLIEKAEWEQIRADNPEALDESLPNTQNKEKPSKRNLAKEVLNKLREQNSSHSGEGEEKVFEMFKKEWDEACRDDHDIEYAQEEVLEKYKKSYPNLTSKIEDYLEQEEKKIP